MGGEKKDRKVASLPRPDHESIAKVEFSPVICFDPPGQVTADRESHLPQRSWLPRTNTFPRRKASHGEEDGERRGIRCAHLLMVDAMATTTPRAILLRANGGSGAAAAPCDTGDALSAMAILSTVTASAKISTRRTGS